MNRVEREGRRLRIGLMVQSGDDWGHQALAAARTIAQSAPRIDFTPLVADASGIDAIPMFGLRLDGVISRLHRPELIRPLIALGLPVVNLSAMELGVPWIWFDEPAIGATACRHLVDRGASGVLLVRWVRSKRCLGGSSARGGSGLPGRRHPPRGR